MDNDSNILSSCSAIGKRYSDQDNVSANSKTELSVEICQKNSCCVLMMAESFQVFQQMSL